MSLRVLDDLRGSHAVAMALGVVVRETCRVELGYSSVPVRRADESGNFGGLHFIFGNTWPLRR